MNIFSGYLSDRFAKRKLFYPFPRAWPQLLLFRVLVRTGKGVRAAPRDAIIAESAKKEVRGKAFGVHRAHVSDLAAKDLRGTALGTFHTSISIATFLSGVIAGTPWECVSPNLTFLYGGGVAIIASLLLLFYQKEA